MHEHVCCCACWQCKRFLSLLMLPDLLGSMLTDDDQRQALENSADLCKYVVKPMVLSTVAAASSTMHIAIHVVLQENMAPQVVGLESHTYSRALPVALYLLFPAEEGKIGLEAIGSRQLQKGLKLLKQKPIVPAIGDLPMFLCYLCCSSHHSWLPAVCLHSERC